MDYMPRQQEEPKIYMKIIIRQRIKMALYI
jgi:hypothetical protein